MTRITARQKRILAPLLGDFSVFAERCLKIRPKDGGLVPFRLNPVQRHVHDALEEQRRDAGRVRALILKARQPGVSTYVQGRFYKLVSQTFGVRAFVLTNEQKATDNIFAITDRFHRHCPTAVRPHTGASNAKELYFDRLDSGYEVGTAGNRSVGRGTTVQLFHGSEVAYWPNAAEHVAGVLQSVPDRDGTEVILESTANGVGGLFHDLCKAAIAGRGDYILIFIPWYWHDEYRAAPGPDWAPPPAFADYGDLHGLDTAQLHWAWRKNAELAAAAGGRDAELCWLFSQEYPATAEEAFQARGIQSYIRSDHVQKARKAELSDQAHAPLILGVDIARGGSDKTRIVDRQGRRAGGRVNATLDSEDLMEVAGLVGRWIDRLNPDMTFVDGTGLGAGVYDRLKERNYRAVTLVNFGAKAADDKRYANKRAEMWGRMKAWLEDPGGADIVDDDEWHAHICAPWVTYDSQSRDLLAPKEQIKQNFGFSPDAGDALALTFAETVKRRTDADANPTRTYSRYDPFSR